MPATHACLAAAACLAFLPGPAPAQPARDSGPQPAPHLDRYGDPLPPGAVARLGTLRWVGEDDGGADAVAFSPDGKLLASGSYSRPIQLWDVSTGREIRQLHDHEVNDNLGYDNFALVFSPDGKWLFSGGRQQAIHVWEVATGKEVRRLHGHTDSLRGVAGSPDGKLLAAASRDGSVRLWDVASGKELRRLAGHQKGAWSVAFSPDGKRLASSGADGTLRVWDVEGTGVAVLRPPGGEIRKGSIAFSPDGKSIAAGSEHWIAHVWDVASKKEVVRLSGRRKEEGFPVAGPLVFMPAGRHLITGGWDGSIHVWDLASGKEERCFRFVFGVYSLALSHDGKVLAVTGSSPRILLRDLATGKDIHGRAGHASRVLFASFSGNQRLRSLSGEAACEWEPTTGKALSQHAVLPTSIWPGILALAPGGRLSAYMEMNGELAVWDVTARKRVYSLSRVKTPGSRFAFSLDGKTAAFDDWEHRGGAFSIHVWDFVRNKEVRQLREDDWDMTCLVISPNGKRIAAGLAKTPGGGGLTHRISLWNVATGKELQRLDLGEDNARNLAFSPDGELLAVMCPGRIMLWDVNTGKEVRRLIDQDKYEEGQKYLGGSSIEFAPDGRSIAAVAPDNTVRLWEVCTGRERCRFKGHRGEVACLAWSPNGRLLASGSDDTTLLVWDVTGTAIGSGRPVELTREQLASLWDDLASPDAARAYRSMKKLATSPRQTTAFLTERLRPARPATRERMTELLARLDSRQFAERERAVRDLERLGHAAEVALLKARAERPSLEVRQRIDRLLERLDGSLKWQMLRAFEVLEWIGTPDVRTALRELAGGDDSSPLTRQAKAALARLQRGEGE